MAEQQGRGEMPPLIQSLNKWLQVGGVSSKVEKAGTGCRPQFHSIAGGEC